MCEATASRAMQHNAFERPSAGVASAVGRDGQVA
jgi:hypothetical protein